ncbi:MAG: phosphoribosylglycinamide formyltransferase [Bacillota bacterium]|jgi:phosphoribosylglycinamide formyltransferase-1
MIKLAVLASGSGTNLQAIIDDVKTGYIPAEIKVVISDKADAYALTRAREAGIKTEVVLPKNYENREAFDAELVKILKAHDVEYIALAGYMRLLSKVFLDAFPDHVVNIHPALLPSFPGIHGQRDAVEYGVKVSGCTVHFVDENMDHGPIIAQAPVPVLHSDTEDTLKARILEQEHILFPHVLRLIAEGKVEIQGRKVIIKD